MASETFTVNFPDTTFGANEPTWYFGSTNKGAKYQFLDGGVLRVDSATLTTYFAPGAWILLQDRNTSSDIPGVATVGAIGQLVKRFVSWIGSR